MLLDAKSRNKTLHNQRGPSPERGTRTNDSHKPKTFAAEVKHKMAHSHSRSCAYTGTATLAVHSNICMLHAA